MSVLLHPRTGGAAPLLWRDWPRRAQRRACMQVLRGQRVDVTEPTTAQPRPPAPPVVLSRAQRAHYHLPWNQRLARNARAETAARPLITLFGIPAAFAVCLGLPTA